MTVKELIEQLEVLEAPDDAEVKIVTGIQNNLTVVEDLGWVAERFSSVRDLEIFLYHESI